MPAVGRTLLRVGAIAAIGVGLTLVTSAAYASYVDVPESGNVGQLRLAMAPHSAERLAAGGTTTLFIEARLDDAASSTLALQLRGWGPLVEHASGLTVDVAACAAPYETADASCPVPETSVVETARLGSVATAASSDTWELAQLTREHPRYLRVTLGVPQDGADDESLQGLDGWFGVGLYASGIDLEPVVPGPAPAAPSLAVTGVNVATIALVAGGAITLGATMRRGVGRLGAGASDHGASDRGASDHGAQKADGPT